MLVAVRDLIIVVGFGELGFQIVLGVPRDFCPPA